MEEHVCIICEVDDIGTAAFDIGLDGVAATAENLLSALEGLPERDMDRLLLELNREASAHPQLNESNPRSTPVLEHSGGV